MFERLMVSLVLALTTQLPLLLLPDNIAGKSPKQAVRVPN
jgi:hypothetical protein